MARLKGGYSHGREPEPSPGGRELPDRRTSLFGLTAEGAEAWLSRGVSQKLYRCPGCHRELEIGSDHVIAAFVHRAGGTEHHHWHRACATEILLPTLTRVRQVSAAEARRDRIAERGRRPAGRRRRR
jgi:hypothetical protein